MGGTVFDDSDMRTGPAERGRRGAPDSSWHSGYRRSFSL